MEKLVEDSQDNGVLTLTLNRPDRLNGFTDALTKLLLDHIRGASIDDSVRVVVLTGAGSAFSCGMDLDDLLSDGFENVDIGAILDELYNPLILALTQCPKPIVCGLNGVAAGGAVSLVMASDIVVARRSTRLVSGFSRLGLMPDCGGSRLFPQMLGLGRAKAFAMMEDDISAEQAHALGIIWKVTDDGDFEGAVADAARHLAAASPQALRMIKRSFQAAATNDLSTQLQLEREWQDNAARAPDFREGVDGFKARRKPVFGTARQRDA